ncbi:MAG: hypothetical protein ACO1OB_34000 [Archangium sp.]
MEQFFTSLSKRQTMLLLTSLAFGGSEAVNAYEHLEPAEEELLKHRAEGLRQIPREKRVPLLVQEIKRLVTQRRRQLASAEPKRLAALLKKERSAMVEVVLNALPGDLAAAVRAEMGNPPPVKLLRDVKPEVLSIVRWKIEDSLRAGVQQVGSFRFTDVMTLQQRDLLAVADRMGARVLATAVAGLGDEMQAFLARLTPDQRLLASKAAEAGAARRLTEKDARLVLEMHGALENPSLGMRSAGAQRIMRAALAQSPEFAKTFGERHQGDLGKLMARWYREEKGKPVKGDGGRMDIVEQLERLAQKGVVDRPMRLPPPVKPPPPMLQPVPAAPAQASARPASPSDPQSKVLVSPPARRPTAGIPPQQGGQQPRSPPRAPTANAPRRDPIAAREARRAGVAASRPALASNPLDSQARGQRVLRDGKPLERNDALETRPPKRSATSPVQAIPKRKDPAANRGSTTSPNRSPVLKGPGRGPNGGSR